MKTLRKVLAIILVICMVMSLASLSTFAAGRPGGPGDGGFNPGGFWGDNDNDNDNDDEDETPEAAPEPAANWSYAYYLGQEYLGNAAGAAVKPDPVGYGFQGLITSLTFTDDAGVDWTFNWSSVDNGEWRITGNGVTKEEATAWPTVTPGKWYVGYCNGAGYVFTLSADGSASSWTYANDSSRHANWFYYIRFIREYTVNVYYENETGSTVYNGVTYASQPSLVRNFHFLYPNGGIIDDSEFEDGEYTAPVTLLPSDYLSADMIAQGYELKYATDANGNDVLNSGVTISLFGANVLNVYCTLIPPVTESYSVVHKYYTEGEYDGQQPGDGVAVAAGADFGSIVSEITKLPEYNENTYTYTKYDVDLSTKTIVLTYVRAKPYVPSHTLGSITVNKTSTGAETPADALFTLTGPEGYSQSVKFSDFVDGSYTFTDLAEGEYSLTESGADVEGFTLAVAGTGSVSLEKSTADNGDTAVSTEGFDVVNTYTANEVPPVDPPPPPYVPTHTLGSVTIEKSSNIMVPDEALFTLYKDGEELVSVSYANFINFKYTFTQLEEGTYTVVETGADIAGWDLSTAYSGSAVLEKSTADNGDTSVNSGTIKVVNTYEEIYAPQTPTLINVEVQKIWVDNSDALGLRPASVQVQLLADGEAYGEPVSLSAENDWTAIWYDLNGDSTYTVDELDVPAGYTKSIDGYTITNTLNSIVESGDPTLPDLTVNKVDGEGKALAGAVFTLSGEGYATTATSDADGKAVFAAIPVGSYTLSETTAPEGYAAIDKTWTVEVAAEKGDYSISVGEGGIINKVWSWITSIFVDKTAKATLTVVNELLPTPPGPSEPPVEEPEYGSLIITKLSTGAETPADTVFTVTGPEGYKLEVKYSDFVNGTYTVAELLPGTYTVSEGEAKVEGYTLSVEGNDSNAAVAADGEANVLITNTYTPEEPPYVPPVIPDPDPVVPDPEPVEPPVEPEVPEEPEEPVEIPEEEVPLAPAPTPVQPGIDLEDIPDEEVPLAQPPQTGDNFLFWLAASILSAIALVFTSLKLRKNEG